MTKADRNSFYYFQVWMCELKTHRHEFHCLNAKCKVYYQLRKDKALSEDSTKTIIDWHSIGDYPAFGQPPPSELMVFMDNFYGAHNFNECAFILF